MFVTEEEWFFFFISTCQRPMTEDEVEHLEMAEAERGIELKNNEDEQLENDNKNNLPT